jgi:hypothetical protein
MVNIPVEAHFLTFTVGVTSVVDVTVSQGTMRPPLIQHRRQTVNTPFAPRRTPEALAISIGAVNRIFAPAGVTFVLRGSAPHDVPAPGGNPQLDDPGFLMVARDFPPPALGGISLLLVQRFQGSEGGAALERIATCAVGDAAPDSSLAHELGHLLGLAHQGDIRDMMNEGLSVPQPVLTAAEIAQVQASALYRRLSSSQVSATPAPTSTAPH